MVTNLLVFYVPPVGAAEECNEGHLRDLGIAVLNCKGDTDPCSTDASSSTSSVRPGSSLYILGDSITVGAEAKYREQFLPKDITPVINASVGRSWTGAGFFTPTAEGSTQPGSQAVESDAAKIQSAGGIVIALGTNLGYSGNPIETMIDSIRQKNPSAPIWWVNTAGTAKWSKDLKYLGEFNRKLSTAASAKNFKIIDWFNIVTPGGDSNITPTTDAGGVIDDGIHPTPSGIDRLTSLVATTVSGTDSTNASGSSSTECCSTGSGSLVAGSNNEEKVWNYLVGNMGLSAVQAAGIMGNIQQESGFSPTIVNKRSGAYGLIQWFAGRETNLENYARSVNKDKGDLGMQLDFMKQELEGPSYKARVLDPIRATNDLAQVTRIWLEKFEIPCSPPGRACDKETATRVPFAQNWLSLFGSNTAGAVGNGQAVGGCGGNGVSADGFVFPLKTTKSTINKGVDGSKWCPTSQENCHHHYNAADIFAETGTEVLAARGGEVILVKPRPDHVVIKGDDGKLYYYTHMGAGTTTVAKGQHVVAGATIGRVGVNADADGTTRHLHFDMLPGSQGNRPACKSAACTKYPFINVQPVLTEAFNALPE